MYIKLAKELQSFLDRVKGVLQLVLPSVILFASPDKFVRKVLGSSPMGVSSLAQRLAKSVSLVALTVLFAVTVSAYTVVMRDGRRLEIPPSFVVARNTLTYEVSPGIQITLALAAIDISATEKTNREPTGSLLTRAQSEVTGQTARVDAMPTRTITNRDLEASARRRRESEAAYEIRRKQLGLPTLEESRRRAAAIPNLMGTELEQKLLSDRAAEIYWRDRASALRTERTALDAELHYVRARLDEVSSMPTGTSFSATTSLPLVSFGSFGRGHSVPERLHRPNVFTAARSGSQFSGRISFGGGATRGQVYLNPGGFRHQRTFGRGHGGLVQVPGIYGPVGVVGTLNDYSSERNALITQFNELSAARAGLNARWRELEDEARRAGASPGWLRP